MPDTPQVQLPPGYEDAAPLQEKSAAVTSQVRLPKDYEDAVPAAKPQFKLPAGYEDAKPSESSSPIPENYGFTPRHMAGAAWEGLGNIVKAGAGVVKDLVNEKTPVLLSDEKPNAPWSERMQGDTLINKYHCCPVELQGPGCK